MKILIICAGLGSRLGELTQNNPKCMVKVNNLSILERTISQLLKNKICEDDIILCGGYKHELLPNKFKKVINFEYENTNMMITTILGLEEIKQSNIHENVLVLYGDCLYSMEFIDLLFTKIDNSPEVLIPVDLDWREKWVMRYENIYLDAETLKYNKKNNKLLSIGKKTSIPGDYMGQFMGSYIIPFLKLDKFILAFNNLEINLRKKISTTEFFEITKHLLNYYVIPNTNRWTEIDTPRDLKYAKNLFP